MKEYNGRISRLPRLKPVARHCCDPIIPVSVGRVPFQSSVAERNVRV